MKAYENKLMEFLFETENFEVLWELYDYIPMDKNGMFTLLAKEAIKALESYLPAKLSNGWETEAFISDPNQHPDIAVYKKEWGGYFDVRLQFGIPDFANWFGLVRRIDRYPYLKNHSDIEGAADRVVEEGKGFGREDWWLGWKYLTEGFDEIEELKALLPPNRNETIDRYSNVLLKLAEEVDAVAPDLLSAAKTLPYLERVVSKYDDNPYGGFRTTGKSPNYRIVKTGLPFSIHYEFLSGGDTIGVEIHLESDKVKGIAPILKKYQTHIANLFPDTECIWDPDYYSQRGRLQVIFTREVRIEIIAEAMYKLIEETYEELDKAVNAL